MPDNNSVLSNIMIELEALKRGKQNIISAGGTSMILTRGSADGELSSLYRKDAINGCNPDIMNIPSETAVVAYVEGQNQETLKRAKKLIAASITPVENMVDEEKLRASTAEAELRALITSLNIEAIRHSIVDETNRATKAEDDLRQKLQDEKERATSAETGLSNALHNEISRASDVEGRLEHAIADEVARATGVEKTLADKDVQLLAKIAEVKNDLNSEVTRATNAEKAVNSKVDAAVDTLRHADEQLLTALNVEITRASGSEASLQTKIKAEIERATNEEKRIERIVSGIDYDDKIQSLKEHVLVHEGIVDQRVSDEVDRAIGAESELRGMITDEVTRATHADETQTEALAAERDRATKAEDDIRENLRAEITRSLSRDDTLDGRITTEVERATKVEHEIYIELGNLGDRINDHDAEYDRKLKEAHDAIAAMDGADDALDEKINTEVTRAAAAEATISANLLAETTRARDAEEKLNDTLIEEIARSKEEDSKVYGVIDAETRRAREAETALDDEISHERARAIAEEEKIASTITSIGSDKVDKNVAGENGTVVNTLDISLEDSPIGDRGAKQIIINKRLISLMNGTTQDYQTQYDLAVLSGAHALGEDLKAEIQRSTTEDQAIREKLEQTVQFVEQNAIDKELFKNTGYQIMSTQEIHTEADAYGSDLWIRTISKNIQDASADFTKEVHIVTDDTINIDVQKLDQNDILVRLSVKVPTEDDISDMLHSILGV